MELLMIACMPILKIKGCGDLGSFSVLARSAGASNCSSVQGSFCPWEEEKQEANEEVAIASSRIIDNFIFIFLNYLILNYEFMCLIIKDLLSVVCAFRCDLCG